MNQKTYLLAKSLLNVYKENNYNKLIKETYDEYKIRNIPFSLLFKNEDLKGDMEDQLNACLRNIFLKSTTGLTSAQELYNTFTVDGKVQEPIVHLINPETADFDLPPIISPALEVEDDPSQGIIDCIVAWYEDGAGNVHQIVIGEQEALTSKWPVYVLSTIDKKDEPVIVAGLHKNEHLNWGMMSESTMKGTNVIDRFCSNEYRLNERYENSGNSEFCIVAYRVEDLGSSYTVHWMYNDNSDDSKKIAEVDKDDINKDLSHWEYFCDNWTPYSDNHVFFNTFERDWYHGKKNLGEILYPDGETTLYLYGNMGSSSNWYIFNPSDFEWSDDVDLASIESSWAHWYDEPKGKLRIWRVD